MHQRCTLRSQPRKYRRGLDLICEALRVPKKRSAFHLHTGGRFRTVLRSAVLDRGSFLPSYTSDRFATHWQSFHLHIAKSGSNASRTFFSPRFKESSRLLNMPPIRNRNSNLEYATTSRRTPIAPHKGDKPNVLRNQKTQVKIEVSAGRALAIDRPHKAKNEARASWRRDGTRSRAMRKH